MKTGRAPDRLLDIIAGLLKETRASRIVSPTLDMSLDRDLGFDSLARVELLLRIEHAFGVRLPEELLGSAETPRDLLDALGMQPLQPGKMETVPEFEPGAVGLPAQARTLSEVLDWHAGRHPDRLHILIEGAGGEVCISYADLKAGAEKAANALLERGLRAGESIAIMLPTGRDYFYSFFGVLLAGCVPVPIYPPFRLSQVEDHLLRHAGILSNAEAAMLITFGEAVGLAKILMRRAESVKQIVTPEDLVSSARYVLPVLREDDVALLQYTSGSTGNPKGVMLSHANLLANIRAMGKAAGVDSADVFVSWLPLYHDMGLIGAWLGSLYHACRYVVMSPLTFLSRPARWLESIARHRATLTASPNFGYALCLAKIEEDEIEGIDLSSLRRAFDGAEPVSAEVIRGFSQKFGKCGLKENAIAPVYGLAESSVGLAFPPRDRGPRIDRVDRALFAKTGRAVPAEKDFLSFVSCGLPLPAHEIRIVDGTGHEVGEREEGKLEFRGPSATRGYFRNPEETAKLFHESWLDSGDYAYVSEGEIYLTGREKDLIIRAGRNIYPYETEEAVGNIAGVRRGCVAVFGVPGGATERLVVMAETKEREALDVLREAVNNAVVDVLGEPPDEILLVPPHTVLKTSSGKIRRSASRTLYLEGLKKRRLNYLRLVMARFFPQLRRLSRAAIGFSYAAYVWFLFWTIAPVAWIFAVASRSPAWSWKTSRFFARIFVNLSGTSLGVDGIGNVECKPSILVVNHASYIDGIVLVAALPGNLAPGGFFSFVAKKELLDSFVSRLYLEHLGARFVERSGYGQASDVKVLQDLAKMGRSLIFFPEGTFTRMPGLAAFRMGAFLAASNAGVPVVPVAMMGARSVLRDGGWFPRQGKIEVEILPPIASEGEGWRSAVGLRDASRAAILAHCGEPDLAPIQATRAMIE